MLLSNSTFIQKASSRLWKFRSVWRVSLARQIQRGYSWAEGAVVGSAAGPSLPTLALCARGLRYTSLPRWDVLEMD